MRCSDPDRDVFLLPLFNHFVVPTNKGEMMPSARFLVEETEAGPCARVA